MAPKSPWNKKTNLKDVTEAASPAFDYGEVQAEEMDVLRAIYMEDFEEVAINRAWSKTTDRSFKLTLKATTDLAKPEDFVVLAVTLTATYPKSVPVLEIQSLQNFHQRTQSRIRNIIRDRPSQLLGEVMIYAISLEIQEALVDGVVARAQGALPSLEDERANAEDLALALAKEAEEAEARRVQEEREEEDRMLKLMVNQEITRRDKLQTMKHPNEVVESETTGNILECVTFDQSAEIVADNDTRKFTEVTITAAISSSDLEETYIGKPKVANAISAPLVAVLRRKVEKPRSDIIQLEAVLEAARKVRHANILNVFAYRVERVNNFNSILFICREFANKGSLYDLLSLSLLHTSKARQFTIQLLEGLEHLHSSGITHGGICARSVYISGSHNLTPKLADFGYTALLGLQVDAFPPRWRSPGFDLSSQTSQRHNDIWDLGVLIVQMFLGLSIVNEYHSPNIMLNRLHLSDTFEDFLGSFFSSDAKKRPSCFDLLPSEFLRTDVPIMQDALPVHSQNHSRKPSSGFASPLRRYSRHNSSSVPEVFSRYANDFTELGRLGRGGFGEVVKARNKLDGGIFAIKKIRQAPQLLGKVLSEVMLLNRLNHPYVVRYYNTWLEEDAAGIFQEEAISTTEETVLDGSHIDFSYASAGGLDFISSTGYPGIEFGEDDDEDNDSRSDDEFFDRHGSDQNGTSTAGSADASKIGFRLNKSRSDSRRSMSTMYIQMELCDRRSLRDLLRTGIPEEEAWRYMRQITEGLAHIHGHGIIHRDLKPDNVFIDATGNPKIGDFGLATTGQYNGPEQHGSKGQSSVDMTRSVGTALYVAPELQSASGSAYNEKVDMYSLGIMFFEMCQYFSTAMERINEIDQVRRKGHRLPAAFQVDGEKAAQGRLIEWLISHKPSERPTSSELLRSEKLPVKIEDETIRQALSGLGDPRSPYHQQLMSALFAHDAASSQRVKARVWETKTVKTPDDATRVRLREVARSAMETVFRRHGAEESRRDNIFPRSGLYANRNVMQLLDGAGNLLQLPYDLTLPHAQQLARQTATLRCTFTFGGAYRDTFSGGPPRVSEEADFDIVNVGRDENVAMNDAEVIKTMDEIINELPVFSTTTSVVFLLNHRALLDAILDHCRVPTAQQHVVKETLSKLGVHQWTWSKLRPELRNFGLSDTTLDDLQLFDWRDTPHKAINRINGLMGGSLPRIKAKADDAVHYLSRISSFIDKYVITCKLYIAPLSCVNAKFYEDGMLFQCLLEKKKNSFILAAGGRYDSLIRDHRASETSVPEQGAIGLCIGIDVIVAHMSKSIAPNSKGAFLKDPSAQQQLPKRCEALVVANGSEKLQDEGIKVLTSLWANNISAELSRDHSIAQEQSYSFIIALRHETSNTVRITSTWNDSEGTDVAIPSVISHIQQELRERANFKARTPLQRNHSSHNGNDRRANNVQVLMARHGSKKSNKYGIVEAAQKHWSEKLDQVKDAPILAIEGRDELLNTLQSTRLGDGESWRKAIQSVQLNERQYMQEVKDMLEAWRKEWTTGEGVREACIYNFRSTSCIYYDLGL